MKFCKTLLHEMENCDPEWGPFWMNYKWLKKQLNKVALELDSQHYGADGEPLVKSKAEREFFRELMREMKKASDFFESSEKICLIRRTRILSGIEVLRHDGLRLSKDDWSRMLVACVNFYRDAVLVENFAVLHLSGFSKIVKKHDKLTGYITSLF